MEELVLSGKLTLENLGVFGAGRCRAFKIGNGGAANSFILPLYTKSYSRTVLQSPAFHSIGVHKNTDSKELQLSLCCSESSTSDFLTPFNELMKQRLYPQVLEQLKAFKKSEEAAKRILPDDLLTMINMGMDGADTYWTSLFPDDRDMAFIRIDNNALVITRAQGSFFQTSPLHLLSSDLPKAGVYQARFLIRYLFINDPTKSDSRKTRRISVNLLVDQLFYDPEFSRAPSNIVMDTSSFFTEKRCPTLGAYESPFASLPTPVEPLSLTAGYESEMAPPLPPDEDQDSIMGAGPSNKKRKKKLLKKLPNPDEVFIFDE